MVLLETSGIYEIVNLINGKKYIGQSKDVKNRLEQHKSNLIGNRHHNNHLQSSFNKYEIDNFEFNSLVYIREDELDKFERNFITIFKTINPNYGYNKTYGGESTYVCSQETRQKMSIAKIGENNPSKRPYVRNKISEVMIANESKKGKNNAMFGKTGNKNPNYIHELDKSLNRYKIIKLRKINKWSFQKIANLFNVSDYTIRCRCKQWKVI
jgi:group I intron endonuclease